MTDNNPQAPAVVRPAPDPNPNERGLTPGLPPVRVIRNPKHEDAAPMLPEPPDPTEDL